METGKKKKSSLKKGIHRLLYMYYIVCTYGFYCYSINFWNKKQLDIE